MPPAITVEILDRMRPNLASVVMERAKRLPGTRYCDVRLQVRQEQGAVAERLTAVYSEDVLLMHNTEVHRCGGR